MSMRSSTPIFLTSAITLLLLGITALGTVDWDVSRALLNPTSAFGQFFNDYGEVPAAAGLFLAAWLLIASRDGLQPTAHRLTFVLGLPLLGLAVWLILYIPFHYAYEFDATGMPATYRRQLPLIAAALWLTAVFCACRINSEKLRPYRRSALTVIALITLEVIVVNLTKYVWGRPRMRAISSFEQFHYWYQIAGPASSGDFRSFPSGHTANGFATIGLSLLIPANKKRAIRTAMALAIIWGCCVALSRVIVGAHFLSDVVAGGYITLLLFFLLKRRLY
ncbi:MAG: hypothetical protein AseanaTS_15750 [Candidatus Pelagadaptatus aseana]|uniref:phosphatase PAP2 family protein n=1 Tax=Candidatus Pelagadaptatus aseana TaxID=3120508 RepID=UPI0039B2F3B7